MKETVSLNRRRPSSDVGNVAAVSLGLLVSQAAATGLVRCAALGFQEEMTAIIAKGYVAVPSPRVVEDLSGWCNAFMGGIFFTASIGSLIVLITLGAVRLVQRSGWPLARQAVILAALGAGAAVFLNRTGLNIGASVYVLAVMGTVAIVGFSFGRSPQPGRGRFPRVVIIAVALVLLAGLWLTRLDQRLFVDIRDRLLLANPVGAKVVERYYDYTLYAAQAMAPLSQRTQIGVDMSRLSDDGAYRDLAEALRRRDVLDVGAAAGAAATLWPEEKGLRWQDLSGRRLSLSRQEILAHPEAAVQRISAAIDVNGPLRLVTLVGILVGFPVMLCLAVFVGMETILGCFLGHHGTWAAALVCLVIGGGLFYPLAAAPTAGTGNGSDTALWREGRLPGRIAVLQQAARQHIDPLGYSDADTLGHSPRLAERYWLARALAGSRSDQGFRLLARMLHDSSPLVHCQVCYALGEMKNPKAIPLLLDIVQRGGHWYTQRYAYAALRKLGWTQPAGYR